MENSNLYFNDQNDESKLIYTVGILWEQLSIFIENVLLKVNLSIAKFNILMVIKHIGKEKGVQQNEISSRLLVTASNITKMLDKLENDGLITRNSKKNDRRVKIIKITDKGSKLLDEIWPEYLNAVKTIIPEMTNERKKEIQSNLNYWLAHITECNNKKQYT